MPGLPPVIDPYDDGFNGLKTFFKGRPMPEFMKTAGIMKREELARLPDHAFAVVAVRHGEPPLRKYACTDAAHVAANVIYFLEHKDELPFNVREKAASNLVLACQRFQLQPPIPLVKAAQRKVLIKTDGAPIFVSRENGEEKTSEVSGTPMAPMSAPLPVEPEKVASAMESPYVQYGPIGLRVRAEHYDPSVCALDDGRLPLLTFSHVKEACRFFKEHGQELHPRVRHSMSVKIASRATDLGIETPPEMGLYSSRTYGSPSTIKAAFLVRKRIWGTIDGGGKRVTMEKSGAAAVDSLYDALFEKRAEMQPELFAEALAELDILSGIDSYWGRIPDPWQTVFTKVAQEPQRWRWVDGADYLTEEQLLELVGSGKVAMMKRFGEDLVEEMTKDPITIFESLPLPTKRAIAHMASQHAEGAP